MTPFSMVCAITGQNLGISSLRGHAILVTLNGEVQLKNLFCLHTVRLTLMLKVDKTWTIAASTKGVSYLQRSHSSAAQSHSGLPRAGIVEFMHHVPTSLGDEC